MTDYLGTEAQRALLARGQAIHVLTRVDPAFTYYGRTVGLLEPEEQGIERLVALARVQGSSNNARMPNARLSRLRAEVEKAGLTVTHYARWVGGDETVRRAEALEQEIVLPEDLTVEEIDA
ncbi:hypothetical protein [Jannaschia seohaensis]|uniref:Uncharacterized protein n=1 Tax=Jannaschia seohaensis TaxID=475081 RepID=A0A2Y9AMR5_9RHOB|nr:hypothetical protein [Jannaschia seohaensis]PWJ19126.1 hypothetical protein BCF38_10457 [Jannaschia seohaensis]SSA45771.1 hypothetical protein SAMN05421539_10457 [Jannaschia seohaensis]